MIKPLLLVLLLTISICQQDILPSQLPASSIKLPASEADTTDSFSSLPRDIANLPSRAKSITAQKKCYCKYFKQFHLECYQQGAYVTLNGESGWAIGYTNNLWSPYDFGWNWYPRSYRLNTKKLQCGCNNVTIWTYEDCKCDTDVSIFIPKPTCKNCKNLGVTFFNKDTCKCECASKCDCRNRLMRWFDYPWCGCMCSRSLKCPDGRYFNRQKCSCDCEPKCCKKGYYQSPTTCDCVPLFIATNLRNP